MMAVRQSNKKQAFADFFLKMPISLRPPNINRCCDF